MTSASSTGPSTPPPVVAYPAPPAIMWAQCPISTTMGSLGRKWTLQVLRDVAFFPKVSFGTIRKCNPGLRQRTLSIRLRQLAAEGTTLIQVQTMCWNQPALKLYEKLGFQLVDQGAVYRKE